MTVGDPFEKATDQGPQVSEEQFTKILDYIQSGVSEGAKLEAGGHRQGNAGYYVKPTIFTAVEDNMTIAREEIFGPVMSIFKFSDYDEVIRRANDSHYGLAAGIWTQNLDTANRLSRALKAGTVWINTYNQFDAALPFGGFKQSGIGRDKGEHALQQYTEVKTVQMPLYNPSWK